MLIGKTYNRLPAVDLKLLMCNTSLFTFQFVPIIVKKEVL